MKRFTSLFFSFFMAIVSISAQSADYWNLIFEENFSKGNSFDTKTWSYCTRYGSTWNKYLKSSSETVMVKDGNLIVKAIVNTDKTDNVPYWTGGIQSKGKFSFKYGKIEVRAKCSMGQGSFPAIWLMPEDQRDGWPKCGEIDIMEVLNYDAFTYQTIHSHFTNNLNIKNPSPSSTKAINKTDYNIYGLEWYDDRLEFYVNGVHNFTYPKIVTDKEGQWPFDKPFYIILNQSLGGSGTWVGAVKDSDLPMQMQVDWVKVYQLDPDAPHTQPAWTGSKPQNDAHWNNTYVKSITTEGAVNELNYTAEARPVSYYNLLPDTLVLSENSTLSLKLLANSLGAYNEGSVLQDLRYTCAYVYADFNNDKTFEVSLPKVGDVPPKHDKGGNMAPLDFTAQLSVPAVNQTQNGRIRVIYHNAWTERASANAPVAEGLVYDINVKILNQETGFTEATFKPQVVRNGCKLNFTQLPENATISVVDFTGRTVSKILSTSSSFEQIAPKGFCIVKIEHSSGEIFSKKL